MPFVVRSNVQENDEVLSQGGDLFKSPNQS